MRSLDPIEAAFRAYLDELGIKSVDHEPVQLPYSMPVVTLLPLGPRDVVSATGGATDATWRWRITVYGKLGDARKAQREIRDLGVAVLAIVRDHPDLGGVCERARVQAAQEEPTFDFDGGVIWMTYVLEADTEEVPTPLAT